MSTRKWEVTEFIGESVEPKTIMRLRDQQSFSIGDFVTNGTKMRGHIEKFDYSFKNDEVFVYTDWSGVGMNLDSVSHKPKLPSAHQLDDEVELQFGSSGTIKNCTVIKVHFSNAKVLYDIEIEGEYAPEYQEKGHTDKWHTRIYNVDSCFVTKPGN